MVDRPKTTICREGWYFVALWAVVLGWALLREENLLILLAGLMLGPLWFNRRTVAKAVYGLNVARRVPGNIHAGQKLTVCLEVTNSRRRGSSWAIEARDTIRRVQANTFPDDADGRDLEPVPTAQRTGPDVWFTCIPAGESQRQIYAKTLERRGCYELGPVNISTRFPFGLFRRSAVVDSVTNILVFPRLGKLTAHWTFRHRPATEGVHGSRRSGRAPGDFFGVRSWQPGDAIRWIHWRSTARRGNLVVRQFERPRRHDVALLLDLWQPAEPAHDDLERIEQAVSFTATLAADLCRRRDGVLMLGVAAAQPTWLHGDASPAMMYGVLQRLAVAEACPQDQLPRVCNAYVQWLRSASEIVLVTTRHSVVHDLRSLQQVRLSDQLSEQSIRTISVADPRFGDFFQESS